MLGYARATTVAAVTRLQVADLDHRFDAKANSIGALLAHVAATEWYYLTTTLEGRQPDGAEWADWGAALRLGPAAEAAAHGRDVAWLAATFTLPWSGQSATHLWAWFHVAEDELNHRGQIRWLRGRLAGPAEPIPA